MIFETKTKKTLNKKAWFLFVFCVLFLFNFILFSRGQVSWIFNKEAAKGAVSSAVNSLTEKPSQDNAIKDNPAENNPTPQYGPSYIEIPKIGIKAPIIFPTALNPNGFEKNLEESLQKGTVYFPDSAMIGEKGQTVILGHSAPKNWPKINYEWVFSDLSLLEKGDTVIIYHQGFIYNYWVTNKSIVKQGAEIPQGVLTNISNVLELVSCWPPGKNYKRIVVEALLNNITKDN